MSSQKLKTIFLAIAATIESQKDRYSELDRVIGDGDHGVTMSTGWQAVAEAVTHLPDDTDMTTLANTAAKTFLNAVGASSGPLYATALMRAAQAMKEHETLDDAAAIAFLRAAGQGILDRGKAERGDKTMADTWIPLIEAIDEGRQRGDDPATIVEAAQTAANAGMMATRDMEARKGRSSRLGERALSHLDPGAVSASAIIETFITTHRSDR